MPETTQFTIGAHASCSDGPCGNVIRVVIDPVARAVTHLVVEPTHREGLGRLVPLDLVEAAPDRIELHCTLAQFDELPLAEETQFLPGTEGFGEYAPGQVFSWPYYAMSPDGLTLGVGNVSPPIVYDRVPLGEVVVRRGEQVHATDGDIGRVQGLVIEAEQHHVTHVLLQEGHLWGRKQVAIPIGAVTTVENGIWLNISKQQVQDLPAVDVDHLTS